VKASVLDWTEAVEAKWGPEVGSVSKTRWITCIFCWSIFIIFAGVELRLGIGEDRYFSSADIESL